MPSSAGPSRSSGRGSSAGTGGLELGRFTFDLLDPRAGEAALDSYLESARKAIDDSGLAIHSTFTGLAAYSSNLLAHPDAAMREDALGWQKAAGYRHGPFTEALNRPGGRIRAEKVLEALEGSGAQEAILILEVIHAFEADEKQVLEEMQAGVEYWKAALKH